MHFFACLHRLSCESVIPNSYLQLPAIRSLAFASPQQTGGIDCGLYLLNNAEVIFRRFDQFSALAGSADDLGQNWFPSFSPLELRQRLAEIIENLSAEQGFSFTSWPDLHLSWNYHVISWRIVILFFSQAQTDQSWAPSMLAFSANPLLWFGFSTNVGSAYSALVVTQR